MDDRRTLRTVNARFGALLDGLEDGDWDRPTPCEKWAIRDVVEHVVAGHAYLVRSLTGEEVTPAPGEDFALWSERAQAAVDSPGAMEVTVRHGLFGEVRGASLVRIRWSDVLVHTWDLSQALGVEFVPEPGLAEAALEWLVPLGPGLARSGAFAPGADPGPEADPFERALALTGRTAGGRTR